MISGLKGENYEEKCKERRLDTPKKRRERQDLLELFKMLNELDPATLFKLKKQQARLGVATRSTGDKARTNFSQLE